MVILWAAITVIVAYIVKTLLSRDRKKLDGIYSQRGRWYGIKRVLVFISLWWNRRTSPFKVKDAKCAVRPSKHVGQFESVQNLDSHPEAIDAVHFTGANKDGAGLIVRIGNRNDHMTEVWFLLSVPGIGVLQLPEHPDTVVYRQSETPNIFTAAGIEVESLQPLRVWTISFNGLCRINKPNSDSGGDSEGSADLHVKCSFVWKGYTPIFDYATHQDSGMVSDSIAREHWTNDLWNRLTSMPTHYEQWGQINGSVYVEGFDERRISMRGVKERTHGVYDWNSFHRQVRHRGVMENGSVFHVGAISMPESISNFHYGYMFRPSGSRVPVTDITTNLFALGKDDKPPKEYKLNFVAGGELYHLRTDVQSSVALNCGVNWSMTSHGRICKFNLNGTLGWGVSDFAYKRTSVENHIERQKSLPPYVTSCAQTSEKVDLIVVPLNSADCKDRTLVGDKAFQLAWLTDLQDINDSKFIVPKGICVTTCAFEAQIMEYSEALKPLEDLDIEDFKVASLRIKDNICRGEISSIIKESISENLETLFGNQLEETVFAVRSSVSADKTNDATTGLYETVLSVEGTQQILEAVKQCWASLFSYQALECRRNRGQPLKCNMGVVIQEMVKSEISGVLYSRHPITGHPGQMMIDASYGLGESVVSGLSKPDTVILTRKRNNEISVLNTSLAYKKHHKSKSKHKKTPKIAALVESVRSCITDELSLELCVIAVILESAFGYPLNIEWAIENGNIALLQSSPITIVDEDTDRGLLDEFDTALSSDNEWLANANIGDILPCPMTPLTVSTLGRQMEVALQSATLGCGLSNELWPVNSLVSISHSRGFFSIHALDGMFVHDKYFINKDITELALFGQIIHDLTPDILGEYIGRLPWWKRCIHLLSNAKTLLYNQVDIDKLHQNAYSNVFSGKKGDMSCLYMYNIIDNKIESIESLNAIVSTTYTSLLWLNLFSALLSSTMPDDKGSNLELIVDIEMILSNCNDDTVAEVPVAIQRIADTIKKSGNADTFMNLDSESALEWLNSTESGTAKSEFNTYLQLHGNWCLREYEMRVASWTVIPQRTVRILQLAVSANSSNERKVLTVENTIAQLKNTTPVVRYILKRLIPKARKAMKNWKETRSLGLKAYHMIKQAYWQLAECMVKEGYLPERDLIFFLTHQEIGCVLHRTNPKLVTRAARRRKVYPNLFELRFDDISIGKPKPLKDPGPVPLSLEMKGLPMCKRKVSGRARVARTLEEADSIKVGDVLVVRSPDIAWVPYYAIISGLVTEIGGLLSHGAMIAQEYDIPCVVNVKEATTKFESGDYIMIDGHTGIVRKLQTDF